MPCAAARLAKSMPLSSIRDAAADDVHLRRFKLAEESILIGDAGSHGIDHVHAHDHLLSSCAHGSD